eukprot:m.244395 g.244395  ORF g.244395 m.244395 type:complete len:826 (-) comp22560_c0_seq4:484-2961(-)
MNEYERIKVIGRGSYGCCVLCKDKKDGSLVVIKQIQIEGMNDNEIKDVKNEIDILSTLHHPNIIRMTRSFLTPELANIVMDYADKGDLLGAITQKADSGGMFTEAVILDWFVQIALALKYIHDRNILHRDIKAQNVFLTSSGLAKLGDFGIAKVLNSDTALANTMIGTPYNMSPELCEEKPYNQKSDIWSFGCLLYELMTLRHAFNGNNLPALILKIVRGKYQPLPASYSSQVRSVCACMLSTSPKRRPSVTDILCQPFIRAYLQRIKATRGGTTEQLEVLEEASRPTSTSPASSRTPRSPLVSRGSPQAAPVSAGSRRSGSVGSGSVVAASARAPAKATRAAGRPPPAPATRSASSSVSASVAAAPASASSKTAKAAPGPRRRSADAAQPRGAAAARGVASAPRPAPAAGSTTTISSSGSSAGKGKGDGSAAAPPATARSLRRTPSGLLHGSPGVTTVVQPASEPQALGETVVLARHIEATQVLQPNPPSLLTIDKSKVTPSAIRNAANEAASARREPEKQSQQKLNQMRKDSQRVTQEERERKKEELRQHALQLSKMKKQVKSKLQRPGRFSMDSSSAPASTVNSPAKAGARSSVPARSSVTPDPSASPPQARRPPLSTRASAAPAPPSPASSSSTRSTASSQSLRDIIKAKRQERAAKDEEEFSVEICLPDRIKQLFSRRGAQAASFDAAGKESQGKADDDAELLEIYDQIEDALGTQEVAPLSRAESEVQLTDQQRHEMQERIVKLRQDCITALGEEYFEQAYSWVRSNYAEDSDMDNSISDIISHAGPGWRRTVRQIGQLISLEDELKETAPESDGPIFG